MICLFIITHKIKPTIAKQYDHYQHQHYEHTTTTKYNENSNRNMIDYFIDSIDHDSHKIEQLIINVNTLIDDNNHLKYNIDNDNDSDNDRTHIIATTAVVASDVIKKKIKDFIIPFATKPTAISSLSSSLLLPPSSPSLSSSPTSVLKIIHQSKQHISNHLLILIKQSKLLTTTLQIKLLEIVRDTFADPIMELVKSWSTLVSSLQGII